MHFSSKKVAGTAAPGLSVEGPPLQVQVPLEFSSEMSQGSVFLLSYSPEGRERRRPGRKNVVRSPRSQGVKGREEGSRVSLGLP